MSRAKTVNPPRPLPWTVQQFDAEERRWFDFATALCHFDAVSMVDVRCHDDSSAKNLRVLLHERVVWGGSVDGYLPKSALEARLLAAERRRFKRLLGTAGEVRA